MSRGACASAGMAAAVLVVAAGCMSGTTASDPEDLGVAALNDGGAVDAGVSQEPVRCVLPMSGSQQQVVVCSDQESLVWARNRDGSLEIDRFNAATCSSAPLASFPNPDFRAFVAGCGESDVLVSDHSIEESGGEIGLATFRQYGSLIVIQGRCLRSQFQRAPEAVARPDGAFAFVKGCDEGCVAETVFTLIDQEAGQLKRCQSELAASASLQFLSLLEVDALGSHILMSESVRLTEPPQRGLWRVESEQITRLGDVPGTVGLLVPGQPALLRERDDELVLLTWSDNEWSERVVGPKVPGIQKVEDVVPLSDGFGVQLRTPCQDGWPCSLGRVWLLFGEGWDWKGLARASESTFAGRMFGSTETPLLLQRMGNGSWIVEEVPLVPATDSAR